MAKEKKSPRNENKGAILSKDAEATLFGAMLGLVSLIGLLNRGPIGSFLTYIAVYLFGVFYFLAFLIAIGLGFYLITKKKSYQVKINLVFLGIIMIILSAAISASMVDKDLTINNVFSRFNNEMSAISELFVVHDITKIGSVGGGLLGFILAGLLNSTITPIGTSVTYMTMMILGLILTFQKPVAKIVVFFRSHSRKRKERIAKESEEQKEKEMLEKKEEEEAKLSLQPVQQIKQVSSTTTPPTRATFSQATSSSLFDDPIKPKERTIITPKEEEQKVAIFAEDIEDPEEKKEITKSELVIEKEPLLSRTIVSAPTAPIKAKPKLAGFSPVSELQEATYDYPSLDLLNDYVNDDVDEENEVVSQNRLDNINVIFSDLNIGAAVSSYKVGPSVTRFDVSTNRDVSVNSITKVVDDISVRLGGVNARFEKVVRGKATSGLEIPNQRKTIVSFKDCLRGLPSVNAKNQKFAIPLGKDISGDVISIPANDFPHLLVAGATGSGKSIFIHCLIMTLLMRTKPSELKIMLLDPKRVEMAKYRDMPHLLCPIITEYDKSRVAMTKLVAEMERRYSLFEEAGVSKISQYNEYADEEGLEKLPLIVVIIDEYADLVENCKEITTPVIRVVQKSRAAGIHIVISTQRPSVNVITGIIKANLPTRVALKVASQVDSMTIIGEGGAEKLLGYGDMLVDSPEIEGAGFTRLQGALVDNKEIKRVVDYLKSNYPTEYNPEFLDLVDRSAAGPNFSGGLAALKDEMYESIKQIVMERESTSASEIQGEFGIGYPRAGRIIKMLENEGIVSRTPDAGFGKRKVLLRNQNSLSNDNNNESN